MTNRLQEGNSGNFGNWVVLAAIGHRQIHPAAVYVFIPRIPSLPALGYAYIFVICVYGRPSLPELWSYGALLKTREALSWKECQVSNVLSFQLIITGNIINLYLY